MYGIMASSARGSRGVVAWASRYRARPSLYWPAIEKSETAPAGAPEAEHRHRRPCAVARSAWRNARPLWRERRGPRGNIIEGRPSSRSDQKRGLLSSQYRTGGPTLLLERSNPAQRVRRGGRRLVNVDARPLRFVAPSQAAGFALQATVHGVAGDPDKEWRPRQARARRLRLRLSPS